jgi:hypothetical protein
MEPIKGTLLASAAHSITIGNIRKDRAVIIRYTGKRGGLIQYGKIVVLNKFSTVDVSNDFSGDDIGVTITGTVTDPDIILTLTSDDSVIADVEYIVEIENIKL